MDRQEGVIKFRLRHRKGPPLVYAQIRTLNLWRQKLYAARLIGKDPNRYGGEAYGNVSARIGPLLRPPHRRRFVITGTQTGGLPVLDGRHYAVVEACFPEENRVVSEGPIRPSSESMTHGTIYALDDAMRYVMHVHSPEIWHNARTLGLPATRASVTYGTPEMAAEVRRLFRETEARTLGIFVMGGHEDGLVVFGRTAEEAGRTLERYHTGACRLTLCDFVLQA